MRVSGTASALLARSSLSNNDPKNGSGDPRECAVNACDNAGASAGDPIDTLTGNFDYSLVDMSLETAAGTLSLQRSYASQAIDTNLYPTTIAPGWTHNHDTRLIFEQSTVWFKAHTLNQYRFINNGDGSFSPYAGVMATLTFNTTQQTYTLTAADQSVYTFNQQGYLLSWVNALGFGFDYTYQNDLLYRVTEPLSGRYLQFNYTDQKITSVTDNAGRSISYGYDANQDLTSFTDLRGKAWGYAYQAHRLTTLTSPDSSPNTILTIAYDPLGRAYEQFDGLNNRIVKITFNSDGTRTLEDAIGRSSIHGFDTRGTNTLVESPSGYQVHKSFDQNFRPTGILDQDGHLTQMTWSANGANLTEITDAGDYTTSMTYDSSNRLIQVTDPNDTRTILTYIGSLVDDVTIMSGTETLSITTYDYTTAADAPQPVGLLKKTTDAMGHETAYSYDPFGQLMTITRIVPNEQDIVTQIAYDAVGRVTDVTDPTDSVTHYEYRCNGKSIGNG